MSYEATFTFTADLERLAVAKGEIDKAAGMSITSESQNGGRTTLIIQVEDPWPESRLDAAQQVLEYFVIDLQRGE